MNLTLHVFSSVPQLYRHIIVRISQAQFFILFVFFACLTTTASGQQQNLDISINNQSVAKVFEIIQEQTDYQFLFNNENIKDLAPVTLKAKNVTVTQILDLCFKNSNLTYTIKEKVILIVPTKQKRKQSTGSTVHGRVGSTKGEPLPGVSVVVKGTNTGTVTNAEGNFTLLIPEHISAKTLAFSIIGFEKQELPIPDSGNLDVVLNDAVKTMDEVVVVGFGKQKKATLTGAISTVGTKELVQSPQANISNALVGRMSGLLAVQRSAEPGSDQSALRIRGVGTFSGAQEPLVMVDGIETPNYNNIDPDEIETVSILKDASSTAVYGVRGANGVLLITTKRGKSGIPQVSFSSNLAVNSFIELRGNMNSYDYARSYNEARKYDSYFTGGYTPKFSNEAIAKYQSREDPIFFPSTDWVDLMLRESSTQLRNNLNISGGTEQVKYFISAGYFSQSGLYNTSNFAAGYDPQVKYNRYNFRSNFDVNIVKGLTANIDISSQLESQNRVNWETGLLMSQILSANPVSSPGVIDGKIVYTDPNQTGTPLDALNSGYKRLNNNFLNGSVRLNYNMDFITRGLSTHGTVSYKNFNSLNKTFDNVGRLRYEGRRLPDNSIIFIPSGIERPFNYGESVNKYRNMYAEFGFDYNRSFGDHTITGLALYNQSKRFDPGLAFLVPNGYQGLVGRVTYNYRSRYLAEFNLGYNGTENFAPGKRFGFFPAYSAGWVASEESFFPKNEAVTFLKIRGSIGEVGNDKIGGDRFLYLPTSYVYTGSYNWGEVGTTYNSYKASQEGKIGNPDLTWERARKIDIGLELGFWEDKIRLTVDWFNENRNNILANRGTIPAIAGANLPAYNLGRMKNSGWDADISFNERVGNLQYWVKGTFTYAHNVVQFRDEVTRPFSYQYVTGRRFGQQFGYLSEGLYNTWQEVNDAGRPVYMWNNNKVQPGDMKFKDINGDGFVNTDDQIPIGYSDFPEKVLGLSFGGSIRGFDFSVLFQGATNVSVFPSGRSMRGFNEGTAANQEFLKYSWTQERYERGDPIKYPRLSELTEINYQPSTYWQEDGSYIRLKNAEIGYTVKNDFLKKIGLSSVRAYLNGSNLLTWDRMLPGEDPEFPSASANNEPYPMTRIVNFGLNIKF